MTSLLALVALNASAGGEVRIVEVRDPEAANVAVQAWALAPPGADPATWRVTARCLSEGTLEFSREELLSTAGQAGRPLLIEATDDLLSVTVMLPADGLSVAAHVVASVLAQPRINERIVREAATALTAEHPGAWEAYLGGWYDFGSVKPADVVALSQRLTDPGRLVVTVAGGFEPGDGAAAFAGRFKQPPRLGPLPVRPLRSRKPVGGMTFVELDAPVLSQSDARTPPTALAAFALGVGKDGAMHRSLRDARQWSYRQEAVFWPTAKGWWPRLVMTRRASADPISRAQVAAALRAEVDAWDDGDRIRALAMAEASLGGILPVNPFHLSAERRLDASLASRAAWAGYLELAGQGALDKSTFLELLRQVTLEELQAAAAKWLGPFLEGT